MKIERVSGKFYEGKENSKKGQRILVCKLEAKNIFKSSSLTSRKALSTPPRLPTLAEDCRTEGKRG